MLLRTYDDQVCSIARALEVVGERWSLLIVRDALLGLSRFEQFQGGWRSSSIPTSSTPTTSPANRSAPSPAHYPAATTASPSTDGWSPRSNASL